MWQRSKQWARARAGRLMIGVALGLLGAALGLAVVRGKLNPTGGGIRTIPVAVAASTGAPATMADLVELVGNSVVNIKVSKAERQGEPASLGPNGFGPDGPFGDFREKFFGGRRPQGPQEHGAGSGFIISPDGYIVTNSHVVEDATGVTVTLVTRQEYPATVIGRDPKTDIAVVKITPTAPLTVARLGDSDQLRVGEWVVAVGNRFGLSNTVTAGIVSAKHRVLGAGPYDDFLQTDAPINPGNSGGPLFNLQGEVVGITTAIVPEGQGLGFAVAVNLAKSLLPELERTGAVTRGYLGVQLQPLTSALAKGLGLPEPTGALVAAVTPGSPAEAAGIQRGDVIVAFNGKAVAEVGALPALVAATPLETTVPVTVRRDGSEQILSVKIGRMPGERSRPEPTGEAAPAESK
jgi:serine protease Do